VLAAGALTADLKARVDAIQQKMTGTQGLIAKLAAEKAAVEATQAALDQSAVDLREEAVSYGHAAVLAAGANVTLALAYGLKEMATRTPVTRILMVAPTGLTLAPMKTAGSYEMECDKVHLAKSYLFERSFEPATDTSWVSAGTSTSRRHKVEGLPPGQKIWFRVAAVTANGQTPWSAPVGLTVA
jgi:hypothetical protein